MFFALGWGFALVAIVLSWASADHGLREVTLAWRSRDEQRDQVNALKRRVPELRAEYPRVYIQLRKQGLIVIEQTTAQFHIYLQTVRKNARYSDIDMVFPDISLPPELSAPEPPPGPHEDHRDQDEKEEQ